MKSQGFKAQSVWEKLGITEHLGGVGATERLIEKCQITPGQSVLDIGCGTGYTVCLLAGQYGAEVVAADISQPVLQRARGRIAEQGLSGRISTTCADIHALSFPAETFDVVLAESVLIFCDKAKAVAEVYRALKRGGRFGSNEFTFLKPAPPEWKLLLSSAYFGLDIQPLSGEEWRNLFERAGFGIVSGEVLRLSLRRHLADHVRVDGWRKYLKALWSGLTSSDVWSTFFSPTMLRAWRDYPDYVGYGLYVSQKY